jgi:hypothetical protein
MPFTSAVSHAFALRRCDLKHIPEDLGYPASAGLDDGGTAFPSYGLPVESNPVSWTLSLARTMMPAKVF